MMMAECIVGSRRRTMEHEKHSDMDIDFGDDMNHAHVQPSGAYHYHGCF